MADISPPTGLKPKAKYFEEVGDTCINVDGVIRLMQEIDTPEAKAVYRAFRKRLAGFRESHPHLTPEKMREEALFSALDDLGIKTSFTPISGAMD